MIRLVVKHRERFLRDFKCGTSIFSFADLLRLPFGCATDESFFGFATHGTLYNSLSLYENGEEYALSLNDKVRMHDFFLEHEIPTPRLFGYTDGDGAYHYVTDLDPVQAYVCKPRLECAGSGVRVCRGGDVALGENWLVQELVADCFAETAQHYRIITVHDGTLHAIYRNLQPSRGEISSNGAQDGVPHYLELEEVEGPVRQLVESLCGVNARALPQCLSVGWDVVATCDGGSVLELNVGHGASLNRGMTPPPKCEAYVARAREWYSVEE